MSGNNLIKSCKCYLLLSTNNKRAESYEIINNSNGKKIWRVKFDDKLAFNNHTTSRETSKKAYALATLSHSSTRYINILTLHNVLNTSVKSQFTYCLL